MNFFLRVSIMAMMIFLSNCVGTIEESNSPVSTSKVQEVPTPIVFDGVESASGIAHDKIEITFKAAQGGSGNLSYSIYLNDDFSVAYASYSESSLELNSSGYYTINVTKLKKATNYTLSVRAYDVQNNQYDKNTKSLKAKTLSAEVPNFSGLKTLENLARIYGLTQIRAKWSKASSASTSSTQAYADASYDFSLPVSTGIDKNLRKYTALFSSPSSGITPGNIYYYTVRPVINGNSSRVSNGDNIELRVIAPPSNMAFINRIFANQKMCSQMGLGSISSLYQKCSYTGLGNLSNYFDLGFDLLVDMFETGVDGTNRPGQYPVTLASQTDIEDQCEGISVQLATGTGSTLYNKRIPWRKEQMIYSQYSSTDDTAILSLESGSTSSTKCNGGGTAFEVTGSNTDCVSYFGVYDVVGNVWEWVGDIQVNGVGYTDDIKDQVLSGFSNDYYDNYTTSCFNHVVALPTIKVSSCSSSKGQFQINQKPAIYFHNDGQIAPPGTGTFGLLVGGMYYSLPPGAGIYTAAWYLKTLGIAGGRCVLEVSY